VDEHLLVFRGKCPFRQYIPTKPGKYGIKVWVLADEENYYCNNLQVYTGARETGTRETNQGARVVNNLTAHLASGYAITTDNFLRTFQLQCSDFKEKLVWLEHYEKTRMKFHSTCCLRKTDH